MRGAVIPKPEILESDCPATMNDFLNHCRLFESLPTRLYEWQGSGSGSVHGDNNVVEAVLADVCSVEPGNAIMESQYFDTLITQQWLRVSMWRLGCRELPTVDSSHAEAMSSMLPFDAGKSIVAALASVSNRSKDCHGLSIVS